MQEFQENVKPASMQLKSSVEEDPRGSATYLPARLQAEEWKAGATVFGINIIVIVFDTIPLIRLDRQIVRQSRQIGRSSVQVRRRCIIFSLVQLS